MQYFKHILLFLLLTIPSYTNGQLQAKFEADQTTGCPPLLVTFENHSEYPSDATFQWNFGNGQTSTAFNPLTNYTEAGDYTITLIVTAGNDADTLSIDGYISIYEKPVVNFTVDNEGKACLPASFNFSNQTIVNGGQPVQYTWSFGDGAISKDFEPQHTYTQKGIYDITLVVTDANGCNGFHTGQEFIHAYHPQAKFGADKVYSCSGSLITNFNNLSESELPLSYTWDFGDENTSTELSPSHLFQQTGKWTVKLEVTNTFGCIDSISVPNLITIENTKASFSLSKDTICPHQTLTLNNFSEDATVFNWDFGDNTGSTDINPTKKYQTSGNYPIHLKASNGICMHDTTITINVESVVANFQAADTFLCEVPQSIQYLNLSENAVRWDWRFGNGKIASSENPSILFEETEILTNFFYESYTDTLIVTSKHGCKHKRILEKNVEIHIPNVKIESDHKLYGCIPKTILFTDATEYDNEIDKIATWSWLVNGEEQTQDPTLTYDFSEPGNIIIDLVISTAKGCLHTTSEKVRVGNPITPDFIVKDGPVFCASETIYFKNTSANNEDITSLSWQFGDGKTFPFPVDESFHNYTDTGYMDVTLTVYNYGCAQTITKEKMVQILGPVSLFTIKSDCASPFDYSFIGEVTDADSYSWSFGDEADPITNTLTPKHTYSGRGDFRVTLTAHNQRTGCRFKQSNNALVRELKANIAIDNIHPCRLTPVEFDATASRDAVPFIHEKKIHNYLWYIGTDHKEYFDDSPIVHEFNNSGPQEINLIIQDLNKCRDTLTQHIHVFQPEPHFEGNHKLGCMPVTFEFEDLTNSDTTVVDWLWDFGDGSTSTLQHPLHDYETFGKYSVSLQVTDKLGCKGNLTKKEHIKAIFPDPTFIVSDSTSCLGQNLSFQDQSESEIISHKWSFGDTQSSSLPIPFHTYTDTGHYSVSLHIIDKHGCEATGIKNEYIHIQEPPVANFKASSTSSNCYPFLVQFTDLSETPYPGSWQWNFGDGLNHSNMQNPSFIYSRPDSYTIQLISSTTYGCSDTLSKIDYINVGGPYAEIITQDTACQKKDIKMIASKQSNIYDLIWDFGDGYSDTGDTVIHQYHQTGHVFPALILRSDINNTCNKIIKDTIHLFDLIADYNLQNNIGEGCVPMTVNYLNQSSNATSYLWKYGDGVVSDDIHPSHHFNTDGLFPTQLIAYNNKHECSDTITKHTIIVHPLPQVSVTNDTLICRDDNIVLLAEGGVEYSWHPQKGLDNTNIQNPIAGPDSSVLYTVTVTDIHGCQKEDQVWLAVQQLPHIELTDTSVIIGESFLLNKKDTGIKTYSWSPVNGLSCSDCPNPKVAPLETTHYFVSITDTSDCFEVIDDMMVEILEKFSLALPSAFTPNGDGVNDTVFVKGWGIKELREFNIYNRFGEKIFSASELSKGWDGTYNGELQPIETYNYRVRAITFLDEIIEKAGYIKLLK